jgi:hypothetical protein
MLTRKPTFKVGLLIGPRGNTLKKMEGESGAKIAIRGKGSVKEGKGRSDAAHASNQEEDLHCLIMADTEEKVNKAKKLIHNIIETVCYPLPSHPALVTAANTSPGRVDPRRPERAQAEPVARARCAERYSQRRREPGLPELWSDRAPQIRLPRAPKLYCEHHLPRLRQRWSHGEGLSGPTAGCELAQSR